jgi:hypothetical protein
MPKPRRRRSDVGAIWFHLTTLSGLLLAAGGLLLGAWVVTHEQEAQRSMLSYLYSRTANPGVTEPDAPGWEAARAFNQWHDDRRALNWTCLVVGALAFAGGGYLAGLGLVAINQRWSEIPVPLSEPTRGGVEEALESME